MTAIFRELNKKIWQLIQSQSGRLMLTQVVVMGVTFLMLPVISRKFSVETMAQWSVLQSIATMFMAFGHLKLDLSLMQALPSKERVNLFGFAFLSCLLLSTLGLFLTQGQYFGQHGQSGGWVWWLLAGISLNTLLQASHSGLKRFDRLSAHWLLSSFLLLPMAFLLCRFLGDAALIWCLLLSPWISALIFGFFVLIQKTEPLEFSVFSWPEIKKTLAKHRKNIQFLTPAALLETVNNHFFLLLISAYFPPVYVAGYFLAQKFCMAPVLLVQSSISAYNISTYSGGIGLNKSTLLQLWRKWGILAAPYYLGLFFFGKTLMPWLFGPDYQLGASMLPILAIPVFFNYLGAVSSFGFVVLNRQDLSLWITIGYLVRPLLVFFLVKTGFPVEQVLLASVSLELKYHLVRGIVLWRVVQG